jgi:senataxin
VCATLSGAGSAAVKAGDRCSAFDAVVVDEAAQAIEASALVPLPLICAGGGNRFKCVLVGDPQQLPATVLSRAAEERLYGRSLFERLQAAGREPHLLSV